MKSVFIVMLAAIVFMIWPIGAISQTTEDYLILNDIGSYRLSQPEKVLPGEPPIGGPRTFQGPAVVGPTGHFSDHVDNSYSVRYIGGNELPSPVVSVTQHAGADSDRWLLHEVEEGYRDDDTMNATYVAPNPIREINGNLIFYTWGYYSWVSNNIAVRISWTDLYATKPEPIEVVKAYLAKHPSTITMTDAEAKGRAHSEAWVKDEMERRLWLGDKWFTQLQLEKAELGDVLREAVGHMGVFLDYREKYYGISADEEKSRLREFLREQNGTEIKNRLDALKSWWADNKGNAINL